MRAWQIADELPHQGFNGTSTQEQTYSICFWLKEIAIQLALLNEATWTGNSSLNKASETVTDVPSFKSDEHTDYSNFDPRRENQR